MSKSQYGEWESRGDYIDGVAFAVASRHQVHGEQCLCGFSSARSRSRTEHIIDAMLTGLADAGIPGLADDDPEHVCEGECSPSERARHQVSGSTEPDTSLPVPCSEECDWCGENMPPQPTAQDHANGDRDA